MMALTISLTLLLLNLPMVLLFGLQVWEYARFHTSRIRELRRTVAEMAAKKNGDVKQNAAEHGAAASLVVVPCCGMEPGLTRNLHAILRQVHTAYRVRFVVESESDPATPAIQRIIDEVAENGTVNGEAMTALSVELLFAGTPKSPKTGRKIHGLLAATRDLPDNCDRVAFFDSDIQPAPWTLWALTSHFGDKERSPSQKPAAPSDRSENQRRHRRKPIGAATGYRWLIPGDTNSGDIGPSHGCSGTRVAGVNGSVAVLFGKDSPTFVWGGAWAMPRPLFDQLRIRHHWHGGLSDDMIVRRVLSDAGYRSQFDPGAVVVGHWNGSLADGFRFIRRQYQFIHHTAPAWWWFAIGVLLINQLAFWVPPAALAGTWTAVHAGPTDGVSNGVTWWGVALLWGTLALLRTIIAWKIGLFERRAFAEPIFHESGSHPSNRHRFGRHGPLTGLYHLSAAFAAGFGFTIFWRGIRYSMKR